MIVEVQRIEKTMPSAMEILEECEELLGACVVEAEEKSVSLVDYLGQ